MKLQGTLTNDLLASVVVFLVALPLCMGIAIASGVPPALGLITGIVGGIVVGSIAGSPLQVSGPAAGLAVIVFELVRDHGIETLGLVLMGAGLIQIGAGALRLGQWFRAMSPAVIYGMLAGIGVLIFAGQFHVMLDDKPKPSGLLNIMSIPQAMVHITDPDMPHRLAALIGVLTIATLVLWNKFRPAKLGLIPGALVAVIVGMATAEILNLPVKFVDVPSSLVDAMRFPTLASLSRFMDSSILVSALAVAFVASAETLLSAAAVDRMHQGPRTNYDRELVAQGVGNSICGFLGALPMTGVIVRSSANVQAGAKSRLSTIMHGTWLLIFVLAAPHVLRMIPTCALAAILVYTGYKLVDVKSFLNLRRYGRMPQVIYLATVIGIVAFDLLTGVIIGVALSVLKLLYKLAHAHIRFEYDEKRRRGDLHLEGSATFLVMPKLASILETIPGDSDIAVHFDRLVYIDHACLDLLANWRSQLADKNTNLHFEWKELIARNERLAHTPMVLEERQRAPDAA
ncbi:MAG TPA: SulP family inorganic anion transporter [Bryobacteraceae bacterium]|nr:SulP family inorganic anion transporter [Bryobacteraceae bacterium]